MEGGRVTPRVAPKTPAPDGRARRAPEAPDLRRAVATLRKHYGAPAPPPTSDPFELILRENVAYLASPARREEAFDLLRTTVGTRPAEILAAKPATLERVTAAGILKGTFAAKLRECARVASERFGSDLDSVVRQPLAAARRDLRAFPGIGEPGAEKILLFAGRQALLAPESNALRVLVRLGLVAEDKSYARMYADSRTAAAALPQTPAAMMEAHLLLQEHGRTLCRRSAPMCVECPLAEVCAYARSSRPIGPRGKANASA